MKPSLIIGIGGTGLSIGHALKYLCHTLLPSEEKDKVKFLFFENDKKQFKDRADFLHHDPRLIDPKIEQKEIVPLTPFQPYYIAKKIEKFHKDKARLDDIYKELENWFDPTIPILPQIYDDGLAANRMIGRMCGYEYADTIRNKIRETGDEIRNIITKDGGKLQDTSLNVIIISSNSGGTGSSLFFDLSLLVDDVFNSDTLMITKAFVFVCPNYYLGQKLDKGYNQSHPVYKNLQINSWAFIDECEYILKEFNNDQSLMGKYFSKPSYLNAKIDGGVIFSPFTSAIIFDQTTSGGAVIPDKKLFTALGEILFYTLTSASNDKFQSEVLRNKFIKPTGGKKLRANKESAYNYSTVGIKTIRFPQEEFSEYFKTRYIYEVYRQLLNENPNKNVIEKKAEEFIEQVFVNNKSDKNEFVKITSKFRTTLEQNRLTSSIVFKDEHLIDPSSLFKDEKGEKFKEESELRNLFHNNLDEIAKFKGKVEEIFNQFESTNYIGFYEEYNNRRNAADEIRERLWEKVYELIIEEGYFAIVGLISGTSTIKGFIEIIKKQLTNLYGEMTEEWLQMDTIKIESKMNELQEEIIKKSKGKLFGTNRVSSAKNEIVAYFKNWMDLRETLTRKYELMIKQKIIHQFAVGDGSIDIKVLKNSAIPNQLNKTDLSEYENDFKVRIGVEFFKHDENVTSLIKEFNDNKKDTFTIKNNYISHLRSKFRETEKDFFTKYKPTDLVSLLDENTDDGWKLDNPLDRLFRINVFRKEGKITKEEFKGIFSGYDKDYIIQLIARLKKNDKTSLQAIIGEINEMINKYFYGKYVENTGSESDSNIGKYLNQTIQNVILGLSTKEQSNLIKEITDVEYPLNSPMVASAMPIGPYINIHDELSAFVKNVLGVDQKMIVTNSALKKNIITSVVYKLDIPYESINQNNIHFEVYKSRDLQIYRPFLDKRWNEYIRGPIDAEDIKQKNINIKIKKEHTLTYYEVFALCVGIDLILQKDAKLRDLLFITVPEIVKKQKLINRSIIFYDENINKQFVYYRKVEVDKNFKLLIKDGLTSEDKAQELSISLDIDKKLLNFYDSLNKIIEDKSFDIILKSFCIALSEHFTDIKFSIKENINEIETGFYSIADHIYKLQEEIKFNKTDLKMAQEFDDDMRRTLIKIFSL